MKTGIFFLFLVAGLAINNAYSRLDDCAECAAYREQMLVTSNLIDPMAEIAAKNMTTTGKVTITKSDTNVEDCSTNATAVSKLKFHFEPGVTTPEKAGEVFGDPNLLNQMQSLAQKEYPAFKGGRVFINVSKADPSKSGASKEKGDYDIKAKSLLDLFVYKRTMNNVIHCSETTVAGKSWKRSCEMDMDEKRADTKDNRDAFVSSSFSHTCTAKADTSVDCDYAQSTTFKAYCGAVDKYAMGIAINGSTRTTRVQTALAHYINKKGMGSSKPAAAEAYAEYDKTESEKTIAGFYKAKEENEEYLNILTISDSTPKKN